MAIMRRRKWILTLIYCLVLAGCAHTPAQSGPDAHTRIFKAVARTGGRATVGIYYSHNEYISYYGTGVVISPDGYILTSTTVIPPDSEGDIEIHFGDHTEKIAKLVESNKKVEASLLKVDATGLTHLPVASRLPSLGERAYSFGNARHIMRVSSQASFSAGRISGIYTVSGNTGLSSYEGLAIETDAAVNPGQDGGPLLNSKGQLAGIISLSFSDARWLGVAVPITRICKSLDTIKSGRVNLSSYPLVDPPPSDVRTGKTLAEEADEMSSALVRLHVSRKYGPETMPRYFWPRYLKKHKDKWDKADKKKRRSLLDSFTTAEKILKANQQVRRPNDTTTGVLISPEGYILTSSFNVATDVRLVPKDEKDKKYGKISFDWDLGNLIDNSKKFKPVKNPVQNMVAILNDGRSYDAEIIAHHKPLNVTLLKVDASQLPHVDIPEREIEPQTGQSIALLGTKGTKHPCTINTGIISAPARHRGQYFQCSAMLNYANSGGPVIGREGRLLGIATAPLRPGPITGAVLPLAQIVQRWKFAPNSGIGMVARIDHLADDLQKLKSGKTIGHLQGAFLGVAMDRKKIFQEGAYVGQVLPDTPAEKAGIENGDQILAIDGITLNSWKDLTEAISKHAPGDKVVVRIKRRVESDEPEVSPEESSKKQKKLGELTVSPKKKEKPAEYKTLDLTITLGERE